MALNSVISVPVGWLCVISMIKSIPVPVQVALGSAIAVPVWWLCVISMIKGIPVGTAPQQICKAVPVPELMKQGKVHKLKG
eukprot:411743-Pelagomonas_calceolata.AAC.7